MHCIHCPGRTQAATAPTRAGLGWGEVDPLGNGTPVHSASFLEGAGLSVPNFKTTFPAPVLCNAGLPHSPHPGTAGTPRL